MARLRGVQDAVWIVQALMIAAAWVAAWTFPQSTLCDLARATLPEDQNMNSMFTLGVDVVRLMGPLAIAMVTLTRLTLIRRDHRGHWQFSGLFSVWTLAWLFMYLFNSVSTPSAGVSWQVSMGLACLAVGPGRAVARCRPPPARGWMTAPPRPD